jgi:hypothetical protein
MALDTVLNSTLVDSRKKLIVASLKSNALVAWAFATNRVETEDGGYKITNPLVTGRNNNVTSYSYYDQLPVAQTDEFDTVEYEWSRVGGTVIISDQEQDENKGKTQIFKLLKAKMDVLDHSIQEKFSAFMYGAGAGKDPNGLTNLIPDDPTTGSLGGISRVTENQWRTSSYNFGSGGLTSSNIEEAYDDVLMDLTLKGDKPDLILSGRDPYRTYRAAVRDKLTIPLGDLKKGGKGMVDLGFAGIAHDNIPIVYDEDCPVNKVYFINSQYLRLHLLKGVNMKVKKLNAPWDTDAIGRRVVWQGQFCMWKAYRTHAVVIS